MKKVLSLLLALTLVISVFAISAIYTPVSGASQYAQTSSSVEGANILHCMCWSYNTIKANLDDIKAAGYTAVQTSCIQPPKDYNTYDSTKANVWWHFYQPVDLSVADGNNWLGTKAELTSLCNAAHEKGIKIIADVVVNHMANPGSYGSYNDTGRSNEINETLLKDEDCWHNTKTALSGSDRYDMVMHDNSNLPDLNTANTKVQNMTLDMLKDAIDCGVDGFRFDAAQNIETPRDAESIRSMFWANTIDKAKTYASNKGKTLFSYGEVYYDAWGGDDVLDDYIWYIGHVTEPNIGMEALGGAVDQNASKVAAVNYKNNRSAKNNVLWVESHDSYYSGTGYGGYQTSNVSNDIIVRAWAIIGSRAEATAMYFARPGSEYVTNATNDTTWKSAAVAEVNKFKNYFRGQSEYLATSGKVAYNERGTSGVVISKLDGAGSVNLTANRMSAGTYKDQISGNTFTVSGGKIIGTVGSTGVAVVYNPVESPTTDPSSASSATNYYLVGSMTSWKPASDYNFTSYNDGNIEQYKLTVYLTAGTTCKAVMSADGVNCSVWYPDGGGNDVSIKSSGWYSFYLRPNGDGNSDWIANGSDSSKKVLYYKSVQAPATEASTAAPTQAPTDSPTQAPTDAPTQMPTDTPTDDPTETYILGDVDGDGYIGVMDATKIQRILADYFVPDDRMIRRGTITADYLNIMDATAVQRYLADYNDGYLIGEIKSYI